MRNSRNPVRGAAHKALGPVTPATGQGWRALRPRSSPGAASLKEGRPGSLALPEQGREDNSSGSGGHHGASCPSPWRGPVAAAGAGLHLSALFTPPPPIPSAPNHSNELSRKTPGLELDRGRGWGKGLKSSNYGDSTWSFVPEHRSMPFPLPEGEILWTSSFLSQFFVLKIRH